MSKLPQPPSSSVLLFLLLLLLFFLLSSLTINSQSTEQQILLKIKQQWNNPPSLNSAWNSTTNYCKWSGVLCDNAGFITSLDLHDMNFTSEIPPSICNLKNLTSLHLNYNYIPGPFPILLYSCSNLQYLDLSQNYFVGPIPDDIDRLPNLRYLSLAANNFSGDIPSSIGNFPDLQVLELHMNSFNGTFPQELGNLASLLELRMAFNQFVPSKIPSDFGRLKKLTFLWMEETNLIGEIPDIFGNLTSLKHLNLKTNDLNGEIPASLFKLKNLTYLYLYNNRLSGEIPTPIESVNLLELDLSINELTGSVPEDFGKFQYLEYLLLYMNQLTGEIPQSIARIPTLIELRLFKNNFSGILPPELGLHSQLETLEVSENRLTGNLPKSLCASGKLVGVIAFSNNLTGGLPVSFENCDSLKSLQLYNNRFSGGIADSFWSLKNISTVKISSNFFSGELPEKLPWNLSRLEMNDNQFTGRIPLRIKSSMNLVVFEASNNLFSGEIPSELTALPQLSTLVLSGNKLSGPIPEIISWASLTTLNLSRNHLSGEIPSKLGSLPRLIELDLSANQFFGTIPLGVSQLRLTFLNLSSNELNGKVPTGFDNLAYEDSFLNNTGLCANNPALKLSPCFSEPQHSRKSSLSRLLFMIIFLSGAAFVFVLLLALFVVKDYQRRKQGDDLSSWKLTSFQRLDFTESNILSNLTETNLIGTGNSGKVYRVSVHRPDNYVAVKKIWGTGKLDQNLEKEFLAEVQILGNIRHSNIVKLLCCISNEKSKFLVYEYLEKHSLDQWLHGKKAEGSDPSSGRHSMLDWPKRMEIAIGASQGLFYMHHSCSPPVIHRDVKSSNILLDSAFNAKIADFGLARMLQKQGQPSTMSVVAGTHGYIAPEHAYTTKVNEKIDVYSFGVVLLELATGKEANDGDGDGDACLAEQAWRAFQDGNPIESALDEDVKKPCYLEEMCMVFKLGLMCTATLPSTRPSMKEVMQILLWRGSSQAGGEKKTPNENDGVPLLSAGNEFRGSNKNSKSSKGRRTSDEAELDRLACNL